MRRRLLSLLVAFGVVRLVAPQWHGRDAAGWLDGDAALMHALCAEQLRFEEDDTRRRETNSADRYQGEWALVTHQMTALGLAQAILQHPEWKAEFDGPLRQAALRSFLPENRAFGTRAWGGEDGLSQLGSAHGHAYLGYPALALGMARVIDPNGWPHEIIQQHDALIQSLERKLLASPTALIETYPHEAYPTDVAAVAAALAVHTRATGVDHSRALEHWVAQVRATQVDADSGYVHQRQSVDGTPRDVPRGSGTGLAAYFAGFVDRGLARQLGQALVAHERTFAGFSGIAEFDRHVGQGDIDSGPVVLGVSVAATGFALAPFRAFQWREPFTRVYRTTSLFGMPVRDDGALSFATGGPIGNALLLAMLTSGPELAGADT